MTLAQRWLVAGICTLAVIAAMLFTVDMLAAYGGRPIVNNPATHNERIYP